MPSHVSRSVGDTVGGTSQPFNQGPFIRGEGAHLERGSREAGPSVGLIGFALWKGTANPGTNDECVTFLLMLLGGVVFVVGVVTWAIAKT